MDTQEPDRLPGTDITIFQEPSPQPGAKTTPLARMVKLYRASRDIDQRALAEEIGIAPNVLSSIERGKTVEWPTAVKVLTWLFGEGVS